MKIAPTFTARTVLSNFAPWIVYGGISAMGHSGWAYVGGLAVSLWQTVPHLRLPKLLDGVSLLFFLSGAVFTLALHSSLFPRDGSILVWSAFAVIAWGSLLIGAPFTAEYARGTVPESVWNSPGFRRVNAAVTAVWGAVFVLNAALAALLVLKTSGLSGRTAGISLQVLPYIGTIFAVVFTNRFPQWASRQRPKS